jgi:hypothetical protein
MYRDLKARRNYLLPGYSRGKRDYVIKEEAVAMQQPTNNI